MSAGAAITDLEELKSHAPVARLLAWRPDAVQGAKLDRAELTVWVDAPAIREACELLKSDAELRFNFLSDLTCVDWHPREPRFEVVYHLLSIPRRDRVRLKVRLPGGDAVLESITAVWPSANFFEREVFDLFGVHFLGHPDLRRLMMPDDWEGHPLRKDYPVEGYR
ncbi:MAG: NADH-quinone oxidoreductase subunit C [Terriglobales bacterium]